MNKLSFIEKINDPNGNLIIDLDRGITHIAYNLLNLPDTICFANGNRIINRYDAAGNKQETQTITLQDTKFFSVPLNGVIFDTSQADTCITRYSGNREFMYTPSRQRDSLLLQKSTIRNAEGYTQYTYTGASDSMGAMQYYFHKDHLGNVCAVWNATTDEVVQRTIYYPSGVPMAQSTGQGVQPLKYNAHEYIETHGYDTYDYGFRGYYATIGRFTSIDPLCERTPWQSPYAYANNNWINQIDYVGLFGMNKDVLGCNFTVVDKDYKVIYHDDDHGNGVYMWQEDEDFKLEENGDIPWSMLSFLGFELPYATYFKGRTCLYMVVDINHGGYGAKPYVSAQIMKGNRLASYGDLLEWVIRLPPSVKLLYSLALGGMESSILKNMDPQVTPYASRVFAIGENVNGISTYHLQDRQSQCITLCSLTTIAIPELSIVFTCAEYLSYKFAELMTQQIYPAINQKMYDYYYNAYAY